MHTHRVLFAFPLVFLAACGVDHGNAPPAQAPLGAATSPAGASRLAIAFDESQLHAALDFVASPGCPVLAADATVTLNEQPLSVLDRGDGAWVTGRYCSSSLLYPSICSGKPQTTRQCGAPSVQGTWSTTPVLMDTPLSLELQTGDRADTFTFRVTLSSLHWRSETLADGSLRLTWQGDDEPVLTKAILVRTDTPAGRWDAALERHSPKELVLPGAASWAPATIELTTSITVQAQIHLTVEAHQAVAL